MLKTGFRNLQLAIRLKQTNFCPKTQRIILTLNYFQHLLHIHWNGFLLFIPWVSNALRIKWQLPNSCGSGRLRWSAANKWIFMTFWQACVL